jgi:hypothetical protein
MEFPMTTQKPLLAVRLVSVLIALALTLAAMAPIWEVAARVMA